MYFSVWMLFSSVSCQRFGNITENSITCTQVNLSVNVDPQSSTFAFNWFLRVDDNTTNVSKSTLKHRKTFDGYILQNDLAVGKANSTFIVKPTFTCL